MDNSLCTYMEKEKPPAENKRGLRTAKLSLKSALARGIDQIYIKFTEGWHSQRGMEESDDQLAMFSEMFKFQICLIFKNKKQRGLPIFFKTSSFSSKKQKNNEKK